MIKGVIDYDAEDPMVMIPTPHHLHPHTTPGLVILLVKAISSRTGLNMSTG
jgi:hypothetical protein